MSAAVGYYPDLTELLCSERSLTLSAVTVLNRAMQIARGQQIDLSPQRIAQWLGGRGNRANHQRLINRLVADGHLIRVEQRQPCNGAIGHFVYAFGERLLAIYRQWLAGRDSFAERKTPALKMTASPQPQKTSAAAAEPAQPKTDPALKMTAQGESKNPTEDFQHEKQGELGAAAPLSFEEKRALIQQRMRDEGSFEGPKRAPIGDREAYDAEIHAKRWHSWLSNLTQAVNHVLDGNWRAIGEAADVIRKASAVDGRKFLDKSTRSELDRMDRVYRRLVDNGWKPQRSLMATWKKPAADRILGSG